MFRCILKLYNLVLGHGRTWILEEGPACTVIGGRETLQENFQLFFGARVFSQGILSKDLDF